MSEFVGDYAWFANLTEKLWSSFVLPLFKDHQGPINYIETGVAEGASLCWALKNLGRPGGLFVGIDPYLNARHWHDGEGTRLMQRALRNVGTFYNLEMPETIEPSSHVTVKIDGLPACEIHRSKSQDYLLTENREFHFGYIDGHHDANNALLDIVLIFRLLRDGGVMVVDDCDRKFRHGVPQVQPAVVAFEMTHEGYFDRLYIHQKQVAYIKRPRRRRGYPPVLVQGPVIEPISRVDDELE